MKRLLLVLAWILFCASSALAVQPVLVTSNTGGAANEAGNNFQIPVGGSTGTGTLSGNLLVLFISYSHGITFSSIIDNKGSTYTLGPTVDSGTNGYITSLYYTWNTASGITKATVNFATSPGDFTWHYEEWANIQNSSNPLDNSGASKCSSSDTGPATVQCDASYTTATSGALILAEAMDQGGGSATLCSDQSTAMNAGSGFSLVGASIECSKAEEFEIQGSAGAINPSITTTGSVATYNFVSAAFVSAAAGTLPPSSGIHLHNHQGSVTILGATQVFQFPSNGNLLIAVADVNNNASTGNIMTIDTCTPSMTWNKLSPAGGNNPQIFYVANASSSLTMHCTIHSGTPGNSTLIRFYDISGATVSPHDTDATTGLTGSEGSSTTTTQSRIATDTTVTITSGTGIANNDFLIWEPATASAEYVQVTAGGGTGTITILRGQRGTTATSHASGTKIAESDIKGAPFVTPTTQPGMAFCVNGFGQGPVTSVLTPGAILDDAPYTGETDSSKMNNGNGIAHVWYSTTSQISCDWTSQNHASNWTAFASTFKAATGGGVCTMATVGAGSC